MEKIIFLPEVLDYFDKLVGKLFEKEYFGFIDSSFVYTSKIYEYIESNIELSNHLKSLILSNVILVFAAAKISNKKNKLSYRKLILCISSRKGFLIFHLYIRDYVGTCL